MSKFSVGEQYIIGPEYYGDGLTIEIIEVWVDHGGNHVRYKTINNGQTGSFTEGSKFAAALTPVMDIGENIPLINDFDTLFKEV